MRVKNGLGMKFAKPKIKTPSKNVQIFVLLVAFSAAMAGLLVIAWTGTYSRLAADDFELVFRLHQRGVWNQQWMFYQLWSGRFAFSFTISMYELAGKNFVQFTPLLTVLLTFLALFFLLKKSFNHMIQSENRPQTTLFLLVMCSSILLLYYTLLPDIRQSLYWQTGNVNYQTPFPLIFFVFGLYWIWIEKRGWQAWVCIGLAGLLSFTAGGYSEISAAVQLVLLSCLLLFHFIQPRNKRASVFLIIVLIASLASLWIMVTAPGNAHRQQFYPAPAGLLNAEMLSIKFALQYLQMLFSQQWVKMLAGFLISLAACFLLMRKLPFQILWKWQISFVLIPMALLMTVFFVVATLTQSYPVARYLTIPSLIISILVSLLGFLVGYHLRKRLESPVWVWVAIFLILFGTGLGPMRSNLRLISSIDTARTYARQWDARNQQILDAKAAGARSVWVSETVNYFNTSDLNTDPAWIGWAMAGYYQVHEIKLASPEKTTH